MDSRPPVIFMHISKTAGSSLFSMLLDGADPKWERSFRGTDALGEAIKHGWASCAVVAGHFDYTAAEAVGQPGRLVTVLRDPIERAISLYRFSHTITDEEAGRINCEMTEFAKASDDRTFFQQASAVVHTSFANAHTRQILGQDWARFAETGRWDQAVEVAMQRLSSMAGFAITEHFERSCAFLFQQLQMPLEYIHQDNRLKDRMSNGHAIEKTFSAIDRDLREFLEEANQLDRTLYNFAVELMNKRMGDSQLHPAESASYAG